MSSADWTRELGLRFRDYRMHMRLTRRDVAQAAAIGMTTLFRFETGRMTDITMYTLYRLLRVIGLDENIDALLPELPPSPYLEDASGRKVKRIRHPRKPK